MTRRDCIFCNDELDNSDEHIIPESLNGRLHSKRVICSNCNSKFGREIEDEVKKQLNVLLLLMGFKNANAIQVKSPDNFEYLLKKDLSLEPLRPKIFSGKRDGKTFVSISGSGSHVKGVLKKMNKILDTKVKGAKFIGVDKESIKGFVPLLQIPYKINLSKKLELLLNKIALEFYATRELNIEHLSPLLSQVNSLNTDINNVIFCNFSNEVRDFEATEIAHVIKIIGDKKEKTLIAYIELFNLICGVVYLSKSYTGKDVNYIYHQDALNGKLFDGDVNLKISFGREFSLTIVNDDFENLNGYLAERLLERHFYDALEENLKRLLVSLKEEETKGNILSKDFVKIYAQNAGAMAVHLSIHGFPYALELEEGKRPYEDDNYNFLFSNFRPDIVDAYINSNRQMLNIRIETKDDLFQVENFHKQKIKINREAELIKVYVILKSTLSEEKLHIPVRELIRILNTATSKKIEKKT